MSMLLAHGGSAGLILEIGVVAAPVVVFAVMAVVAGRNRSRQRGRSDPEDQP